MRKRSTQEILEVLGVYGNPDLLKKREEEIDAQKKKDQGEKPSKTEQEISKNENSENHEIEKHTKSEHPENLKNR